jgi:hypothetical protein
MNAYIRLGYSQALGDDDMAPLWRDLRAGPLADRAFALWDDAVERSARVRGANGPSLFQIAWTMHKRTFSLGCLFGAFQGLLNNAARPLLLRQLIEALVPSSDWTDAEIVRLLVVFGLVLLLEGWCKLNAIVLISIDSGMGYASWVMSLVQRKATTIVPIVEAPEQSPPAAGARPGSGCEDEVFDAIGTEAADAKPEDSKTGDAKPADAESASTEPAESGEENSVNESALLGNDLLQQLEMLKWSCHFPSCLVGLLSGTGTLIYLLGLQTSAVGLITMVATLCLNRWTAHLGSKVTKKDLQAADARISVMREVIHNILPVKFLGWEQPYLDALGEKRAAELRHVLRYRLLLVVSITMGRVSPVLAAAATFTFMGIQGRTLDAAVIFSALAAFNALRMPLITLPLNLMQFLSLRVSVRRIQRYLLSPDRTTIAAPEAPGAAIEISGADLCWSGGRAATSARTCGRAPTPRGTGRSA